MTRRRFRLTVIGPLFVALILIVMFIFEVVIGAQQGRAMIRQGVLSGNKATLSVISRVISDPLYDMDLHTVETTLAELPGGGTSIVHAAVRDLDGQVIAEARGTWFPSEQDGFELAVEALETGEIRSREVDGRLILSSPVTAGLQQIGTLEIAFDQAQLQTSLGSIQVVMGGLAVTLVIIAVVLVGIIARYAIAPLRELTAAADEIGRGNLDVSVPIRGTEETATLGVALERMRADLQALYRDLEQQVVSLERRARYQEATTVVARDVASVLDVEKLLSRVVRLVSEQLGFYHTGVFLLDSTGEWAELRAASSEGGRRMLLRGYRLRVGEEEVVGHVAGGGEARVALDVGEGAVHFDQPDLSGTRSEVALPLRARGEVLGVLDVQSREAGAFSDENVAVLQTLADQTAMAISNARLFQQVQEALEAERRAYGEVSLAAWAEALHGHGTMGYYCDAATVVPVTEAVEGEDDGLPTLDIPITVHDQVIGTIRARKPKDTGEWTENETDLVRTLVDQLGLALESARLYQDTRRRAARERLTAGIAGRVRETLDIDMVLQTAVREISEALSAAEVEVRMSGGVKTKR
ncbi:MAG: GAF domain-containing protein [Anaerolineae bacterium]|nr:GAF domain-containing protein [Anaerolineae bacterium]